MDQLTLKPIKYVEGDVILPGSKSLSNRALLLAALAKGKTQITNLLDADDISHMLISLKKLNIEFSLSNKNTTCEITGNAGPFKTNTELDLYLGNAGTAMRPLTAALCLGKGKFHLHGEPRMHERPIKDLIDALRMAKADIKYLQQDGYPPLLINANGLTGGKIKVDGRVSSQFLTALLMAMPLATENTEIEVIGDLVSKPYIDITIALMKNFSVHVENENYQNFFIKANQQYISPGEIFVEGDASSASYFLSAGAIRGGTVTVYGAGRKSVQGDIKFAEVLSKMGAIVEYGDNHISVTKNKLNGIDIDLNHIPDAAMTIATTALFADGRTCIRNIANWRVKETDRLSAMATELRKVGAKVEEGDDYICITPPKEIKYAEIDTYNDHRMAMCFSLAALGNSPITINNPKCCSKTFPDYFDKFNSISK
jgi:3-phosphoshikimate 1-carboxyvinyltransferase